MSEAGTVRMARTAAILGSLALLAACVDSGLPDKNLPLDQATIRPFRYQVYDASRDVAPVRAMDRDWRPAGPATSIPESLLTRVATDNNRDVFALATETAPYSRLYVKADGGGFVPMAID